MATNYQGAKTATEYLFAVLLSLILLFLVMHLRHASWSVPFEYGADALLHSMAIKGTIDNGWYLQNPYLGAPGTSEFYDFPFADTLHMALMKALSMYTSNHGAVLNFYFVSTFPLTTVTALYVFQRFGISYSPALSGGLLYAFLPYHFMRNEHHLFLAAYFMVPLAAMVVLWISAGFAVFEAERFRVKFSKRALIVLAICVAVGSGGVYYAFFTCFLLLVAGVAGSLLRKNTLPAISALALVAVIALTVLANYLPSVIYRSRHGVVPIAVRGAGESETFGLKLSQLVLPTTFHRVPALARLKQRYNEGAPLVTENDAATLGFFGTTGFLVLLVWSVFKFNKRPRPHDWRNVLDRLSILNIAAVLLGTIGGLSSIFALLVWPSLRSQNRISLFIAFFSIFAFCLILDNFFRRVIHSRKRKFAAHVVVAVIIVIGVLDQTGRSDAYRPNFKAVKATYDSDAAFVGSIEGTLAPNAMVFQLPYARFPEQGPINNMADYSHLRGYLHSRTLRWSYGATWRRAVDAWQSQVTAQPTGTFLEEITFAGFTGLMINRRGYSDHGEKLEAELSALLNREPLVSKTNELSFFSLKSYGAQRAEMLESAAKGNTARVRELLDNGVNVNMRGPDGDTPLMEAAYAGHAETVKLLLERGADQSARKRDGATVWTLASHRQVLDLFNSVEALVTAAGAGEEKAVKELMDKGVPLNALNRSGAAALHSASWHGRTNIVRALLGRGADPHLKKTDGATALSLASGQNHQDIVELLNRALSKHVAGAR